MLRLLFILALFALAIAPVAAAENSPYQPGELLVILPDGGASMLGPDRRLAPLQPQVAEVMSRHGLDRYQMVTRERHFARPGGVQVAKLISSREGFDPVQAARELMATGAFRAATPNYHAQLTETVPNDFYVETLPYEWHINQDAHSHLPEAWDIERGDSSVVIAIMDTGVDTGHPDLMNRIWTNPGEIPDNAFDDDGNGYVDDVHGWDFGNEDNDPKPHAIFDSQGIDVGFHGTHMSGIAAAETNNSEGMAGVCWDCRIMPLKILDSTGTLTLESITEAVQYATEKQVDVLSMSLSILGDETLPPYMQVLIDDATNAGVVCVASAGNDTSNVAPVPAVNDNVLAVGATNQAGERAFFSNWGSWVDVCAPGRLIWSAVCTNYEFDLNTLLIYILFFTYDQINPYMSGDGTSMSTPQVSGVAALIRSRWPSLTSEQVAQRIIDTGDVITTDLPIGVKLNAYQAVLGTLVDAPQPGAPALRFEAIAPNPVISATTIRFSLAEETAVSLALYDVQGRRVRQLTQGSMPAGAHVAQWDGRDDSGRRLTSGIYFARLEGAGLAASRRIVLFDQ